MRGLHVRRALLAVSVAAAWTVAALSVSLAGQLSPNVASAPFIVSSTPESKDFHAVGSQSGRRTPYFLSTNVSRPANDGYCGVVVRPDGHPGFPSFESLSFAYSGTANAKAIVNYKPPLGALTRTFLNAEKGKTGAEGKDGFKEVSFTGGQFAIPSGSSVREIVIVPPAEKAAGRFRIDDIRINQTPVKKALATKFFAAGKESPAGSLDFTVAANPGYTDTRIRVKNGSSQTVWAWVALNVDPSTVFQTPSWWPYPGAPSQTMFFIPSGGGWYAELLAGKDVITNTSPGYLSGNFSFGLPNKTGPRTGTPCPTTDYPCGANLAEFTLNVASNSNEACNISCINGLNASIAMDLENNAGYKWATTGNSNLQLIATKQFLFANNNNPGVYPFNCPCCNVVTCGSNPNCDYVYAVPPLGCSSGSTCFPNAGDLTRPSTTSLCQATRATPGASGGVVLIKFLKFPPTPCAVPL